MLTLEFTHFPEITTARLHLRKIAADDTQALFEMRSNIDAMKFIDRAPATSIQEAEELLVKINQLFDENNGIGWGISMKNDPLLIGTIGFHRIIKEQHRAEIGYMLHPAHHRNGVMHEAMEAVLHHGFHQFRFHSIEANVNPENEASIRLLEKNRFVREGYFRENHYYNGKFGDTGTYSLPTPLAGI